MDSSKRARCNHCGEICSYHSGENGETSLKRHMLTCDKLLESLEENKNILVLEAEESIAEFPTDDVNRSSRSGEELKALAMMIIIDKIPLKLLESNSFREFITALQPNAILPSRKKIVQEIFEIFGKEKNKLKSYFSETCQRVCLSIDTWTSVQDLSYMILTAHFIDADWKVQKKIINFCQIPDKKGVTISMVVEECLLEWGIKKVLTVTVDNDICDDVAISYLVDSLRRQNCLVLNGDYMHMRCFAHILNLLASDVMNDYHKSIEKIRKAVRYVKSSREGKHNFVLCVESVDIKGKIVLHLDVPTQWESTYLMLDTAEKFQKAFEKLEEYDNDYVMHFDEDEKMKGLPTNEDWCNIRDIVKFLKVLYDMTSEISGSLDCTSYIYLGTLCNLKRNIQEFVASDSILLGKVALGMKIKYDKYFGEFEKLNYLMYVASVLDPRCKMQFVVHCLNLLGETGISDDLVSRVKNTIERLHSEYKSNSHSGDLKDASNDVNAVKGGRIGPNLVFLSFLQQLNEENNSLTDSEVDQYLSDSLEKFPEELDVLNWWELNSLKYPILSKIAKDILVIPISTFISESTLSEEAPIYDEYSCSLLSKTLEAVICTNSWFGSSNSKPLNGLISKKVTKKFERGDEGEEEEQDNMMEEDHDEENMDAEDHDEEDEGDWYSINDMD